MASSYRTTLREYLSDRLLIADVERLIEKEPHDADRLRKIVSAFAGFLETSAQACESISSSVASGGRAGSQVVR